MQIEIWPIENVRPYENNPRKNDAAVEKVANSLNEFGWQQPIVVDEDGVIIAGHTRYKAAQMIGMPEVPVHVARGLSKNQADAYRLADNKTGELSDWDFDKLLIELENIDWMDCDMTQFGFYIDRGRDDNPYTSEVKGLVYEPSAVRPSIFELCDTKKADELRRDADGSGLPEEEREFLRLAAMRHVVFDYGKIADYYASASPEMQDFMERSALVIVDFGKAIENGYVKVRTELDDEVEAMS